MATWFSGISRYHRTVRKNVFLWCLVFLAIFTLLVVRLFWLQVVRHGHYQELGERYRFREAVLPAMRGRIRDCNFAVLAQDDERLSLYADPTLCTFPWEPEDKSGACAEYVAKQLAPVIERPETDVLSDLQRQVEFVWVKVNLSPDVANTLRNMALPGMTVKADGHCYRVGVDFAAADDGDDLVTALSEVLKLPADDVRNQLGLTPLPEDENSEAAHPKGKRWVRGVYHKAEKEALEKKHLEGLIFAQDRVNESLGVDPRPYLNDTPGYNADAVAKMLEPILGMKAKSIKRRLEFRRRFIWLKRPLTQDMLEAVLRLQGTLYVVQPGRILTMPEAGENPDRAMDEAVDRLYSMINGKKGPEVISRQEIHRRLQPGAEPGPLAEKLYKGGPSLEIKRRLNAVPIPGVVYGLPGIATQHERRREYPYGTLAAPTLGFVLIGGDGLSMKGVFGIEETANKTLTGKDGFESKEIDARRNAIPEHSERIDPVEGKDVFLTLDRSIQMAAEESLAKAVKTTRAAGGQCVVMDCNTGEILALASAPSWNANNPGKSTVPLVNPVISHFYEPGSTFKLVPVLAALEEGLVRDGQTITNCGGPMRVGNRSIREAHNYHGRVDPGRLLEQSCNISSAMLALELGPEKYLDWCERLGFGKTTGIELRNESPGFLNRQTAKKARITLANMGFGQSMAVTPLQMVAAYSVVANGGNYVQPHLIKYRVDDNGKREPVTVTPRRVCSEETAELMRGYFERVVTEGTGGTAKIPGYRVAGKTGTAQKAGPGGYGGGKAIGSFIGFLPVDKPRLTIIALIDEPQTSHYGGVVAAPVFAEVGRQAMHYLNVPPSKMEPERGRPARE
ncbi:MAG: peptidoglycan D,D-transpeptidase FtsI family protein [Armatimonadota bacterium]